MVEVVNNSDDTPRRSVPSWLPAEPITVDDVSDKLAQMPLSIGAVRRHVNTALLLIDREIDHFLKRAESRRETLHLLEYIARVENVTTTKTIDTPEQMLDILKANSNSPNFRCPEFFDLRRLCLRQVAFFNFIADTRQLMKLAIVDNLFKYCKSFMEDVPKTMDLPIVANYENFIIKTRNSIQQQLDSLDAENKNVWKLEHVTVRDFIRRQDSLFEQIMRYCDVNTEIIQMARAWLIVDNGYARKLQDTIAMLTHTRSAFVEQMTRLKATETALRSKVFQTEFYVKQIEKELKDSIDTRNRLHTRGFCLDGKESRFNAHMANLHRKRDENITKLSRYSAAVVQDVAKVNVAQCEERLRMVDTQLTQIAQQRNYIKRDIKKAEEQQDISRREMEKVEHALARRKNDLGIFLQQKKLLRIEVELMSERIEMIRKIREIKQQPDTVRKIFHYGYYPGVYSPKRDDVDEFLKLTSKSIGNKWEKLYHKLPFSPGRSFQQRSRDIEQIDIVNRRVEAQYSELSYKSLQKWRRLSRAASVDALTRVLRQMNIDVAMVDVNKGK